MRPGNAALISGHAGRSGARVGGAQGLYGGEGGGFPVRVLQRDVGAAATEHLSGGKDGWSGRDLRFLFVKVPLTSSLDFFHIFLTVTGSCSRSKQKETQFSQAPL